MIPYGKVYHKIVFLVFRQPKMIEKTVLILAVEFKFEDKSGLSFLEKILAIFALDNF